MSKHAIHHVTAVTAQVARNLEYYTGVLGLRLVKRSVNQDDVSAYHLFYADAVGTPGTDMTFFDWPSVGPATPGMATISTTSFRVHTDSKEFWEDRLSSAGSSPEVGEDEDGRWTLRFADPEGQRLALVEDTAWPVGAKPWTEDIGEAHAIRGILGVDLESARPEGTRRVLTDILGFEETAEGRFETASEDAHARIRIVTSDSRRIGRVGAGGVHHVAFRVKDDAELLAMQERVEAIGLRTSGYIDRFYFHSLYFREPGGILFELATDGPGFGSDEDFEHLGEHLALPPFLEDRRAEIEAGLKPLPVLR